MTRHIIPLTPLPQTFVVTLGGTDYRLTLRWCDVVEGGWLLDVALADGPVLIAGLALVTGVDLLGAHGHLGFGGMLWCWSPTELPAGPDDLGIGVQLIFESTDEEAADVAP